MARAENAFSGNRQAWPYLESPSRLTNPKREKSSFFGAFTCPSAEQLWLPEIEKCHMMHALWDLLPALALLWWASHKHKFQVTLLS